MDLFSNISNLHLDWCRSDHRPIEISISNSMFRGRRNIIPRRFKFEEHWSQHSNCSDIIKNASDWSPIIDSPSGLAKSLCNLSSSLSKWGWPISNSISKNIENCRHILKKAYSKPVVNFTEILNIENNLDNLLTEEEIFGDKDPAKTG